MYSHFIEQQMVLGMVPFLGLLQLRWDRMFPSTGNNRDRSKILFESLECQNSFAFVLTMYCIDDNSVLFVYEFVFCDVSCTDRLEYLVMSLPIQVSCPREPTTLPCLFNWKLSNQKTYPALAWY